VRKFYEESVKLLLICPKISHVKLKWICATKWRGAVERQDVEGIKLDFLVVLTGGARADIPGTAALGQ
jgi:hypothetical protein